MSNEPFVEDTILMPPAGVGPTIRRSWEPFEVKITFSGNSEFFTREIKIHHPTAKTIGELNRLYLHELLDKHINDYLKGTRTE